MTGAVVHKGGSFLPAVVVVGRLDVLVGVAAVVVAGLCQLPLEIRVDGVVAAVAVVDGGEGDDGGSGVEMIRESCGPDHVAVVLAGGWSTLG